MAQQLTLDQGVAAGLLNLLGIIKPFHDAYFALAVPADNLELKRLVKYIRKRSHQKGEQWKDLLFFLNDFVTVGAIPATPGFAINADLDVPGILRTMLETETTVREKVEDCIAQARDANENRVILFLNCFVKEQAHHERKLDRLLTLWDTYQGDAYEWQKEI